MRKSKYPSDLSRVWFEQIRPLLEGGSEADQAADGRSVRGVLRCAVFAQERLPVADAAGEVSQVAHRSFLLCEAERARP
jgi:hypothetical protein